MARKIRDVAFVDEMRDSAFAPHIAPVNELVRELRQERPDLSIPFVASHYDATTARVLSLLSNPGPRAKGEAGSGFLSTENDDGTAERLGALYERVGARFSDVIPWNACPWYVHDAHPNGLPVQLIAEGQPALHRLLQTVPGIRAVVAHGGDAHRAVRMYFREPAHHAFIRSRGMRSWTARHTGNRAFSAPAAERERRLEEIAGVYWDAMSWARLRPTWATARDQDD